MAQVKIKQADFTTGSIYKKMIQFSIPLFASNMLQAIYNLIDMIIVGQYIGKVGISAVSIGGDLLTLLTFIAMGFSNAGQVIIAQNIGAKRKDRLHKIVGNLFTFLLGAAVILSLISWCIREWMLRTMNTPADAYAMALSYLTICSLGLVFIYGYNVVSAVLRGMGDSKHPFYFVAAAAVMNMVLDLLFVMVFHMEAAGAALATVISQGMSFIVGLCFLAKNAQSLNIPFSKESFIPDKEILLPIIQLGAPMALKSASVTFSKLFVDAWINSYGVIASSASGIESKFNMIANLFNNAINVTGSTMIGQNIGAEKYERVPRIMLSAFSVVFSIAVALSLSLILFPNQVFGLFTSDKDVLKASISMIPLLIVIFAGGATRSPNNGLIDGSGNYKLNFVVAILDGIVNRISFSLLFGLVFNMGWIGFLWGDAVAGFTPFIIGSIYYFSGKWKKRLLV